MFISTRYLFKQLFFATLSISVILSTAIWLTQSLRFIDVVINKGLPFTTFFKLTFYLFPDIFGLILPIGLFIAIVFSFNKLENDHELIIFRGTGVSDVRLAMPALMLAGLVMIFLYYVNMVLMPLTLREFKEMEHTIKGQASALLLQEDQFTNLQGATVYVRAHKPDGILEGIFVHDARKPSQTNTVVAETGYLNQTPRGLQLVMNNGSRQQLKRGKGKPEFIYFDTYTVNLNQYGNKTSRKRGRKAYEMGLSELLSPPRSQSGNAAQFMAEAHKRLVMPLLAFVFALIGVSIMLFGEFSRRRRLKRILAAIGCVLLVQLLVLAFLNVAPRYPWVVIVMYSFVASVAAFFFSLLKWQWRLPQILRRKA